MQAFSSYPILTLQCKTFGVGAGKARNGGKSRGVVGLGNVSYSGRAEAGVGFEGDEGDDFEQAGLEDGQAGDGGADF